MSSNFQIQNKKLLIVDDNHTNIILMQAILEEEKFTNVHIASSAIEAYDVLEDEDIDLIFMDISMPEIDGLEATQAIKANQKYSHVPIIIVTAVTDDETLKKSFDFGATDFIRKPINRIEFIARLNTILESKEKESIFMQHSRFDAMEEIIGMLAHQWRQPLGIISAIVGTLQTQQALGVLETKDLDDSLERISSQTGNLSDMISTFREFFKADSTPCFSSVNKAILEAQRLLSVPLEKLGIRLKLDLADLHNISYIQNHLVQILTSLITNSKEAFTKNNINEREILIKSYIKGSKINILIQDNAGGIEKETMKHIFEPYFTTKDEKNGKGLGLFIAKSIFTQQFNGQILVSSNEDTSEFLLIF